MIAQWKIEGDWTACPKIKEEHDQLREKEQQLQKREQTLQENQQNTIKIFIQAMRELNVNEIKISKEVKEKFELSDREIKDYLAK